MIKMIAFDLFGVILKEGHLVSNVLVHLLPPETDKKLVKCLYEEFNLDRIDEPAFWSGVGIREYQSLRQAFINSFEVDIEYAQVIDKLQKKYKLSILSNLPAPWADELMKKFNFEQYFNPCMFSGHLGCKKPQPEIYKALVKQSGLEAKSVAFIDDRLENLNAAAEQGLMTIYYRQEHEAFDFKPDYQLEKMRELLIIFNC